MQINVQKLNDIKVHPLVNGDTKPANDMFFHEFVNCVLLGATRSGKSSVLSNILKRILKPPVKKTFWHLYVFSPTIYQPIYKDMESWCEKKGIDCQMFPSFDSTMDIEDGTIDGKLAGALDQVLHAIYNPRELDPPVEEEEDEEIPLKAPPLIRFGDEKPDVKRPAKKYVPPEHKFILVVDDLAQRTKDPRIDSLLIKARWHKCSVFLSVQYEKFLSVSARINTTNLIIFPGTSAEHLREIWEEMQLQAVPFPIFRYIYYKMIDKTKYHFLYIDRVRLDLRRNFDERIDWEPSAQKLLQDEISKVDRDALASDVKKSDAGVASLDAQHPAKKKTKGLIPLTNSPPDLSSSVSAEPHIDNTRPASQSSPRKTVTQAGYLIH